MNVRNIRPTPDTYRGVTPRGVTPREMGREDVSTRLSFDREREIRYFVKHQVLMQLFIENCSMYCIVEISITQRKYITMNFF